VLSNPQSSAVTSSSSSASLNATNLANGSGRTIINAIIGSSNNGSSGIGYSVKSVPRHGMDTNGIGPTQPLGNISNGRTNIDKSSFIAADNSSNLPSKHKNLW